MKMVMNDCVVCLGLIMCFLLTLVKSNEYYLVAAPKYLRFGVDETLSVSYHGNRQLDVTILLRHMMKEFSVRQVTLRQGSSQLVNLQVTRENLGLNDKNTNKPRLIDLVVKSRLARSNGEDTKQMLISYNTGYIFIQTDKPIYSKGFDKPTKVYIRVMPLDENFRPPVGKNVTVEIIDPHEVVMSKKSFQLGHDNRFIRDEMILDSLAVKGIWTVMARFGDELETETNAFFEVNEYVTPTFEVRITNISSRFISEKTEFLRINVKSTYVYGKPVRGTCSLRLKLTDENRKQKKLVPYVTSKEDKDIASISTIVAEQSDLDQFCLTDGTLYCCKLDSNGHVEVLFDVRNDLRPILRAYEIDGKRLVLDAIVLETVTGNTQTVRDQSVFFSNNPYILKFSRSSSSFQPGYPYKLHIDVFHLAGDPAAKVKLQVEISSSNATITTDENGHAIYILNTNSAATQLQFKVKPDESRDSITHTVQKYNSSHSLQLQIIDSHPLKLEARTYQYRHNGLFILTLSRGILYDSTFFPSASMSVHDLSLLQHQLTPTGRSIAYFIHHDGEVVADQIKYDVRRTCLHRELTVTLNGDQVQPGANIEMSVTGVENTTVGLVVSDKAVLVSNIYEILERSQMFDMMEAHDRGCNYGGGVDDVSVFSNAGMVVLTNARLSKGSISNLNCPASTSRRLRRSTGIVRDRRSDGADSIVLDFGEATRDFGHLFIRSRFQEAWLFEEHYIGSSGMINIKRSTPDSVTEWRVQAIGMSSKYGICISEPVTFQTFKRFFLKVELPYKAVRLEQVNIQVTIFNYDHQDHWVNVYIEPWDTAICSSTKMGTKSEAKRVLVQANDAHTVTYPILPLKAGDTFLTVYGVIPGRDYDAVKKALHIVDEGIEDIEEIQLCLDPQGHGKAICKHNSRITVQNDPENEHQIFTVDLTLPDNAIRGTGQCVMYLAGNNIMDIVVKNTIKDVNKLFRKVYPHFSGESALTALAQSVYAMLYLDETAQLVITSDMNRNGWRLINEGIKQIKKHRKSDGSYTVWISTDTCASTWFTAFVLKVLCQVDKLSDDLSQDIFPGLEWLANSKQNADGSFVDDSVLYHREIQATDIRKLSLTAFTLITLLECRTPDLVSQKVKDGTKKAMEYVEGTYTNTNDKYVVAIVAYALAKAKSPYRVHANKRLKDLSRTAGQDIRYWGLESEAFDRPSAKTAETTCYALLTQLEFDDLDYARGIVNWLNIHMRSHGSFRSVQDTVVCLQALSKYNIQTYNDTLDLEVIVQASGYSQIQSVNHKQTGAKAIRNVPVGEKIRIDVRGKGAGHISIDVLYNRQTKIDEVCDFKINISNYTISQEDKREIRQDNVTPGCDLCGFCPHGNKTEQALGRFDLAAPTTLYCITVSVSYVPKSEEKMNADMSVVDIGIQSGFKLVNDRDLRDMLDKEIINHIEKPGETRNSIVLYVNYVPKYPDALILKFALSKEIKVVNEFQPAAVTVYQYDDSDTKCTEFYHLMSRSSGEIRRSCEGRICVCLEEACPKCYEEENGSIKGIRKIPFGFLMGIACDQSKADFIFHVKILKIHDHGQHNKADAEIIKVIKRGAQIYDGGDTVYFEWESICQCPKIKENEQYVIIAKDGPKYRKDIYLLRDSAIVWDDSVRLKRLKVSTFVNDVYRKKGCGV